VFLDYVPSTSMVGRSAQLIMVIFFIKSDYKIMYMLIISKFMYYSWSMYFSHINIQTLLICSFITSGLSQKSVPTSHHVMLWLPKVPLCFILYFILWHLLNCHPIFTFKLFLNIFSSNEYIFICSEVFILSFICFFFMQLLNYLQTFYYSKQNFIFLFFLV
jgi:hypothetical protein